MDKNIFKNIINDWHIKEIKNIWNNFFYRCIIRILWPLIPISMEFLVRFLIKVEIQFPNKTILVLAFIIPASYLPDFRGEISINLISMACLLATIPFFCSIISNDEIIYWVGFILFLFFILIFLILDFLTTYRKHSNIIEKGD